MTSEMELLKDEKKADEEKALEMEEWSDEEHVSTTVKI